MLAYLAPDCKKLLFSSLVSGGIKAVAGSEPVFHKSIQVLPVLAAKTQGGV